MAALAAGLLLLAGSTGALAAGYYAQGGAMYDPAGQPLQVRGISHFGFNAEILQPQYLWEMGWKEQIAQIKALGFNAVRLPFVPDTLYVTTTVDKLSYVHPTRNADLIGKTPLQVLDLWMAEANRQGLYVMLDFHSVTSKGLYPTWFSNNPEHYGAGKWAQTYNNQPYTAANWKRDLAFVASRYKHLPYFFAVDIYNEPNGTVRWSAGDPNMTDPAYYWKPAAESAAAAVLAANPNVLVFVQGINGNYDGIERSMPMNWGEDFQPQAYQPLDIPSDKLVLSPHTYGPDVFVKPTFSASNFPSNLAADWETLFGQFAGQHPVVISEWGGKYGNGTGGSQDITWQNALVDYLLSKGIRSSFYWCYTPNSGDTGGILDDNLQVRQDKLALLQRHWGGATPPPPAAAGAFAFAAPGYTVAQNAGTVTVSVTRSNGSSGAVSVRYATADGTARAGTDYTSASGTLSWASGDAAAKTFTVAVSNAQPFQGARGFTTTLSSPSTGTTLGSTSSASVTINGSDSTSTAPSTLALSAQSYTVKQDAGSLTVTVNRTGSTSGAVSVAFATADGTARAGTEYTARTGTLSWAGGDAGAKTVLVPISNATPYTGSRTFEMRLSNPSAGAVLGASDSATATISGSGNSTATAPGTFSLTASSAAVAQGSGALTVTVQRAAGTAGAVSVRFRTIDGTARAGTDYTSRSGTLRWAAGDGSAKSFSVPISNAAPFAGNKTFSVRLSHARGGAALGTPAKATVTITGGKTAPPPATWPQPYIQTFWPTSGPVGTVVTIDGHGFTGLNQAWAGAAHDAGLEVLSDTRVRVTIPAGATTGAIGILNPEHASFTASSFSVTN